MSSPRYRSIRDELWENDAGDLKYMFRVVGANAEHSVRVAAWLAGKLNLRRKQCCDAPGVNPLDGRCCNCGGEMS